MRWQSCAIKPILAYGSRAALEIAVTPAFNSFEGQPLPVLYSFRRCPYAMRTRLAIAASGVRCELREILLRSKPSELLAISLKATVPVLLLPDGKVIEQSLAAERP